MNYTKKSFRSVRDYEVTERALNKLKKNLEKHLNQVKIDSKILREDSIFLLWPTQRIRNVLLLV